MLYRQDHPHFEIIVVNDRSDDGTGDWLQRQAKSKEELRAVTIDETPKNFNAKKYALSLGIKEANYDVILLTDADCWPETDHWIQQMSQRFTGDTQIVLGYSPYAKMPGWINGFIRFETLLTAIQYLSFALWGSPYMGVGRNLAYRKSFFNRNNGFQDYETITGGDDDLFVNRYGTESNTDITIGREVVVWSSPKTRLKDYFNQKNRHLAVGKYYKLGDKIKLGLFSLSHIIFWSSLVSLGLVGAMDLSVLAVLLLRTMSLYLVFILSAKKLGDQINLGTLLLWDLLFAFYYLSTGVTALAAKNIKWG